MYEKVKVDKMQKCFGGKHYSVGIQTGGSIMNIQNINVPLDPVTVWTQLRK